MAFLTRVISPNMRRTFENRLGLHIPLSLEVRVATSQLWRSSSENFLKPLIVWAICCGGGGLKNSRYCLKCV